MDHLRVASSGETRYPQETQHNNFSDHMTALLTLIQFKMLMLIYESLYMG